MKTELRTEFWASVNDYCSQWDSGGFASGDKAKRAMELKGELESLIAAIEADAAKAEAFKWCGALGQIARENDVALYVDKPGQFAEVLSMRIASLTARIAELEEADRLRRTGFVPSRGPNER